MLDTELAAINAMDMGTKAKNLYAFKYDYPEHAISQRCIDFKAMEQLALNYKKS